MSKNFWQEKTLFEMNQDEWESVCDGCGKCCLQQLQDEDTGQLVFTDVACDLLIEENCRCEDYENRSIRVPTCISMNKDNVQECAKFAPPSCAYRLLLMGDELPDWHHLNSGSRNTIHEGGYSVRGRIRMQRDVAGQDLANYVVDWPSKM